jgi:hypothetical protein
MLAVMPRYNFRFTDGKSTCSDVGGLDLVDDESARREAELAACDLLEDPGEGDWSRWTIEVTDEKGRRVTSIAVDPRSKYSSSGAGSDIRM